MVSERDWERQCRVRGAESPVELALPRPYPTPPLLHRGGIQPRERSRRPHSRPPRRKSRALTRNVGDEVRVRLLHLDLPRLVLSRSSSDSHAANPDASNRKADARRPAGRLALLAFWTGGGGGWQGDVGSDVGVVDGEQVEEVEQVVCARERRGRKALYAGLG